MQACCADDDDEYENENVEDDEFDKDRKKAMYTELSSCHKPQSVLHEEETILEDGAAATLGGAEAVIPATNTPKVSLHHSKSAAGLSLSLDTRVRSRRYRHKRSRSYDNYPKMMSPRKSPHALHVEKVRNLSTQFTMKFDDDLMNYN